MNKKTIIFLILLNLILGNAILYFSKLAALIMSFIGGSETAREQFLLHMLCSTVAVLSILFTSRIIITKPRNLFLLSVLSIIGAFLVPFLSTFIMFAGYNLLNIKFIEFFGKALFMAISTASLSTKYWLPFAIGNLAFFVYLNNQSKRHTANQASDHDRPN
jgi:hypothetical protein